MRGRWRAKRDEMMRGRKGGQNVKGKRKSGKRNAEEKKEKRNEGKRVGKNGREGEK